MSEPKRHHYVPRSYLEFFADGNSIWVYDKSEGKYFNTTLENAAVIQHYYSIISDDNQKDNSIEKYFSELEGATKPVLRKIHDGELIDQKDRLILAMFIAYQFTRVPAYEKENKDSMDRLRQIMKDWDIPAKAPDNIKPPDFLPPDTPRISVHELHNYLAELNSSKTKSKNQHLEMLVHAAEGLVDAFLTLDWTFVYADQGSSFITSSNPFTFTFHNFKEQPRVMGVLVKDVIKLFPISSRVCLMMGNVGTKREGMFTTSQSVEEFNLVLADNSDRYLLHKDKSLLEVIVKKLSQ